MARKVIDCRDYPSETKCTIAIAADDEEELLDLAVIHAVESHDYLDTPELREQLREGVKESVLT
jgi:predicted small metal-binding protein